MLNWAMNKKRPSPPAARRRAQEMMDPARLREETPREGGDLRNQFEEDYPGPTPAANPQPERADRRGSR
jgi:hypothetical protein